MPLKKDKAILTNSILGASVGLLLNICLVKHLQSVGSAIVWVCSEFTVLLMAQYYVKKYKGITFPFFQFTRYLICLKSATPFPKCYLHKEKWTFDS